MANQTAEQIAENIFQSVDTILAQRLSHLPYDQTIICEITDTTNAAAGRYLAKTIGGSNDVSFTVYSDKTDYEVGQKVYVRVPFGDLTEQKVITGSYVAEQAKTVEEVSSDTFWKAPNETYTDESLQKFGSLTIYNKNIGSIFPGYQVCRLQFTPEIGDSLKNSEYSVSELDLTFKITVNYTIPTILSTTIRQKSFTVSLRSLNANLLRNPNKLITYDINFDNIESDATNLQINSIILSDLQYTGTIGKDSIAAAALNNIQHSFGFYLTSNAGVFLKLYSDSNFYNPNIDTSKTIYAHYYLSTDRINRQLEYVSNEENTFSVVSEDDTWTGVSIEDDGTQYVITLPVTKNKEEGKLHSGRENFVITLQKGTGNIEAADSINLVNADFYAALQRQLADGQSGARFLTSRIYTIEDPDEYHFNNGIYYIYGQDGQTTDASAYHIKRRAYIKFVDYFSTVPFDVNNLECKLAGAGASMINLISTQPQQEGEDESHNYAFVEFTIQRYYSQSNRNNSLYWTYTTQDSNGDDITYEYTQELLFGYSGSQGADYSLILSLRQNNKEVPAILAQTAGTYTIEATLYDYNNEKVATMPDITYEKIGQWGTVTLSGNTITVPASFSPTIGGNDRTKYYSAVIKATISSLAIEGFITIPVRFNENYILSGPSTITYDITGKKPFASKLPYSLINNNLQETGIEVSLIIPVNNLSAATKSLYPEITERKFLDLPSVYSNQINEKPPTIVIKQSDSTLWVQPLYIWQNKYPNSMLNGETRKVIIPETSGDKEVISTNVGRILSNNAGVFIGDYGTNDNSNYGLFAFKAGSNNKVDNIFKLTADGEFNGDLVLTDKSEPVNIGDENIPVYYKDGKPVSTMKNIVNETETNSSQATLEDIAQAISDLRDAIEALPNLPTAVSEILERIKIKVKEENNG